ncbi:hypothetical protein PC9H_008774 [Pleurotus ostreatus]|uniref:Uncharacterized protein n=1 Tax=Pleurotus ostreatus TaxID=5322 RepID=A0A8H7DTF0_PLEOS|nr:uncharacterized protein PC9H_008774 [Pleurotus ostreatus]KAF7426406.1 hypothetical protein PC9H_008774 [Pleurotus ostreatus]
MVSHFHNYTLPLNAATLVTFHDAAQKGLGLRICQVMISTATSASRKEPTVDELATFFIFQHEISKAVESILLADILAPLPEKIILEGDGYTLVGTEARRDWRFGATINARWGKEPLVPTDSKWRFLFEVRKKPIETMAKQRISEK